jgi:hypothetical protein
MLGKKLQSDCFKLMSEALTKIYAIAKEDRSHEILEIIEKLDKELDQMTDLPEDE